MIRFAKHHGGFAIMTSELRSDAFGFAEIMISEGVRLKTMFAT
jgi:hypothetical protein